MYGHNYDNPPTPEPILPTPWEGRETRETVEVPSHTPPGKEGNSGNAPWWSSAITGAELDAIEYPPLEYLVEDVLVRGGLALLAGPPKAGKSYLSYGIACAVAAGGKAIGGLEVNGQGNVLLISLDDQSRPRAQRRLREVMRGEPIPAGITLHTESNLGRGHVAAERLKDYLKERPDTRLIVIDTLEHLRPTGGSGSNSYSEDVLFLGQLRGVLTEHPDVTILVLTHTRKGDRHDPDDPITAVSGSHGVTGGTDAVLVLTGTRGAPRRKLDIVSRDGQDKGLVLKFTDHGLEVTADNPDDPTVHMSEADGQVYRLVQEHPSGVDAATLQGFLPEMKKIGNRLALLAKDGYITKEARGVYKP